MMSLTEGPASRRSIRRRSCTHCPATLRTGAAARAVASRVWRVCVVPVSSLYVPFSRPCKFMHAQAAVRTVASYFRAQVHAHVRLSTTTTNSGWNSATILGNLWGRQLVPGTAPPPGVNAPGGHRWGCMYIRRLVRITTRERKRECMYMWRVVSRREDSTLRYIYGERTWCKLNGQCFPLFRELEVWVPQNYRNATK